MEQLEALEITSGTTIAEQRCIEAGNDGTKFDNYISAVLQNGAHITRYDGLVLYKYNDGSQILRQMMYWDITTCGKCLGECQC